MLFMGLCYLAAAPCLLVFAAREPLAMISTGVVMFSFGRALGAANEGAILCDLLAPRDRSTAQGLVNTTNCLAGGIGILLAGVFMKDWGLSPAFAGVSVLVLLAAAASLAGFAWFLPSDLAARAAQRPAGERD